MSFIDIFNKKNELKINKKLFTILGINATIVLAEVMQNEGEYPYKKMKETLGLNRYFQIKALST